MEWGSQLGSAWRLLGASAALLVGAGCGATPGATSSGEAGTTTAVRPGDTAEGIPTDVKSTVTSAPRPTVPIDDDRPTLTAVDGYEKIRLKPVHSAPIIGLMRAGQSVPLKSDKPVEGLGVSHCKGGWYEVLPRGYVCIGTSSSLHRNDPRALAAAEVLPDLSGSMPYSVGTLAADSPFYQRIPTREEQQKHEPGLDDHLANLPVGDAETGTIEGDPAGRGPSEAFVAYQKFAKKPLLAERKAYEGRLIAWATEFDAEGRTWLVTPNLHLVAKDKVFKKTASTLHGVDLKKERDFHLPLAFAWDGDIDRFLRDGSGRFDPSGQKWPHHGFIPLSGQQVLGQGFVFWETRGSREWVKHTDVTILRKKEARPVGVGPKDKWVHVRITWGTLVAYEGNEPVFATAISPGADGVTTRDNGHHTQTGVHHIGWKMFSADMNGTDKGVAWAVDEVPYTAYYKDSFAVHGAWWHDEFGRPKSHGCINLAPADARFLWEWLDPGMPEGWYAVTAFYPEVKGTVIEIRP